jgi:signal transduction histidine kinase
MAILLRRHRSPVPVFLLLALLSVVTCQFLPYRPLVLVGCAWFVVTSSRGWRVAALCVPAVLGLVAGWTLDELRDDPTLRSWSGAVAVGTGYLVLMAGVGLAGRSRLASLVMLRISERRRRQEIRAERLRLARELHDVVMHAVTLMVIQAEAARTTVTTDPEATSASLAAISRAGARATTELREMLQVLRPVLGAEGDPATAPPSTALLSPTTASLDDLVASARDAGVYIEVENNLGYRDGGTGHLGPAVRLTMIRTVQEALTNILRHAGPGTRARVAVHGEPDALLVEVVDDGNRSRDGVDDPATDRVRTGPGDAPPPSPAGVTGGNGLVGLAERAAALGGTLRYGPRPDHGYGVLLRLPVDSPSADTATGTEPVQVAQGGSR